MRVRLSDAQGPRGWRLAPYALPLLLFLLAIWVPSSGAASLLTGVSAFAVFNLIGLVGVRQRRPRSAELECGPGYVDVKQSGSRNQRIHASDIVGATTARTETALLLTLQHKRRDQPMTLEVEGEAEADKIRHAIGIGHSGFGTIAWRTNNDYTQRAAFVGRVLALIASVLTLVLTLAVSFDAGLVSAIFFGQFGVIGAIIGLFGLRSNGAEPTVVMTADGLRLKTPRGWFALPYEAVLGLYEHQRGLVFTVPPPYGTVGVERVGPAMGGASEADRKILVAQVMAAAARARGLGPRKEDVSGRVEILRRNGESPREWLVRLDMTGQMLSAGSGYRGNTLDAEDLWSILEDPEAEPDLRAAAARVLRQTPNARVRIDAAVAAVRDGSTNRRLRIAVDDDLDGASEELAQLDAAEPRAPLAEAQSIPGR